MNTHPDLAVFRPWLYAAAVYNFAWGSLTVFWPSWYFDLLNIPHPAPMALWQFVGMVLAIFAPAFWWAARYPEKYPHLIFIAFLGKTFGLVGFLWTWGVVQDLPAGYGWTIVTNDIIWWPAFALYVYRSVKLRGGWKRFLLGE